MGLAFSAAGFRNVVTTHQDIRLNRFSWPAHTTARATVRIVFDDTPVVIQRQLRRRMPAGVVAEVDGEPTMDEIVRFQAFLRSIAQSPDIDVVTPLRPRRRRLGDT